jgi:photosystem II stability/assembly factor-like uncharacterized protein
MSIIDGDRRVRDVATLSENVAIAVIGSSNELLRTENGGQTWETITLPTSNRASSVAFTDDGVGWTVGKQGVFFQSVDGGKTWRVPANLPSSILAKEWRSLAVISTGFGIAVGEERTIAVTKDNGKTWRLLAWPGDTDRRDAYLPPERLGKVCLGKGWGVVLGNRQLYALRF